MLLEVLVLKALCRKPLWLHVIRSSAGLLTILFCKSRSGVSNKEKSAEVADFLLCMWSNLAASHHAHFDSVAVLQKKNAFKAVSVSGKRKFRESFQKCLAFKKFSFGLLLFMVCTVICHFTGSGYWCSSWQLLQTCYICIFNLFPPKLSSHVILIKQKYHGRRSVLTFFFFLGEDQCPQHFSTHQLYFLSSQGGLRGNRSRIGVVLAQFGSETPPG